MNGNVAGMMVAILRDRQTQDVNYAAKTCYVLSLIQVVTGASSPETGITLNNSRISLIGW